MCQKITAAVDRPQDHTPVQGVVLHAVRTPGEPFPLVFRPTLYLVLQGSKTLVLGGRQLAYHGGQLVLMGVDLPALAQITRASQDAPYLALEMAIDRQVLAGLIAQAPQGPGSEEAVGVHPLPFEVLAPATRLLALMEDPTDARVLAEGLKREVLYRVLRSPGGKGLVKMVRSASVLAEVGHVTAWLQDHLDGPVPVEALADRAAMSTTSFHRRFKAATGTTPGWYHKMLRLHEARRLVALGSDSMTSIAAAVGYASPSQFSRDYKRAFGLAPARDARRFS